MKEESVALKIPLENVEERVISATNIDRKTYLHICKEAEIIASGKFQFPTFKGNEVQLRTPYSAALKTVFHIEESLSICWYLLQRLLSTIFWDLTGALDTRREDLTTDEWEMKIFSRYIKELPYAARNP